jgi:hypothetical protein
MDYLLVILAVVLGLTLLSQLTIWLLRKKHLDRWMPTYIGEIAKRKYPSKSEDIHILLCVADHYEPRFGGVSLEQALARVRLWATEYPRQFSRFRDSDGRMPRHSFFFPAEEYDPQLLDTLSGLCAQGFGEVEIHLHHDEDTPENLRLTLEQFRDTLANHHGLLGRKANGAVGYAFIHGNWALCNSRPDGRYCGVDQELAILQDTGCYVDMTFPSAPSPTQPAIINRIYYAKDRPGRGSHQHTCPAGEGLMLIQGPLLLDWKQRKHGLFPGIENGCLQATQPPTLHRLKMWTKARVQVGSRPDWFFVKLHAHGAPEDAHEVLLGEPMLHFHQSLAAEAARNPRFHFHYVSAREMYNLAKAAEQGYQGSVVDALDYEILPAPLFQQKGSQSVGQAR